MGALSALEALGPAPVDSFLAAKGQEFQSIRRNTSGFRTGSSHENAREAVIPNACRARQCFLWHRPGGQAPVPVLRGRTEFQLPEKAPREELGPPNRPACLTQLPGRILCAQRAALRAARLQPSREHVSGMDCGPTAVCLPDTSNRVSLCNACSHMDMRPGSCALSDNDPRTPRGLHPPPPRPRLGPWLANVGALRQSVGLGGCRSGGQEPPGLRLNSRVFLQRKRPSEAPTSG